MAVAVEIHQDGGVRLRPRAVDDVRQPAPVGGLLDPHQAVIVRAGGEDVHAAVLIDIDDVHEAEFHAAARGGRGAGRGDGVLVPVGGMELPLAGGAHIFGRFEPALGREDVVAPVAIDIAHADAVAVALVADDVFHPLAILQFEPCERNIGAVELGEQFLLLAVVVEVHQEGEFGGAAGIDFVDCPRAAALPGILQPDDFGGEVAELDDVNPAVAIHVEGDVGEVVDVVGVEVDRAEGMLDPVGRFVPVLAGDDVGTAVVVEVGDRHGFVEAGVDHADPEGDVRRTARSDEQDGGSNGQQRHEKAGRQSEHKTSRVS